MAQQTIFPSELEDSSREQVALGQVLAERDLQGADMRQRATSCGKAEGLTIPLSELAVGAHALICRMKENPQIFYLQCMGFTAGAHVEAIRRVSGGALTVYRVEDADVALRREAAAMISVRMEG
jgi:Fe2+ transport system protein FeoA